MYTATRTQAIKSRHSNVCSHPHAVLLELSILVPKDAQSIVEDPIAAVTRKRVYAVTPEFSFSRKRRRRAHAVAEVGAAEDAVAGGGADEYTRTRVRQVNDTMHPFWAVRRMTTSQLANENQKTNVQTVQTVPMKFNTELEGFEIEAYRRKSCKQNYVFFR